MSAEQRPTPYAELAEVLDNMGLLLREARRARGLSFRAAAAQIGCSFSTVSRIEAGEDARWESYSAVLRWLDQTHRPPRSSSGGTG